MTSELPLGKPVSVPDPVLRPEPRELAGTYVTLTPIALDDISALYAGTRGTENDWMWTYLPYGPFDSETAMRVWAEETFVGGADPMLFTATQVGGSPVGAGAMMNIVPEHQRLEIGHIWFAPSVHGTPVITEANYLWMKEAFDGLGYRRVEWKCDSLNARSFAAAKRLGFTFEGIFRNHIVVKGRNRDTAWLSITDAEWPDRKAKLERWLYENPDGKLSLRAMNQA